jgi:hypothetical protein
MLTPNDLPALLAALQRRQPGIAEGMLAEQVKP